MDGMASFRAELEEMDAREAALACMDAGIFLSKHTTLVRPPPRARARARAAPHRPVRDVGQRTMVSARNSHQAEMRDQLLEAYEEEHAAPAAAAASTLQEEASMHDSRASRLEMYEREVEATPLPLPRHQISSTFLVLARACRGFVKRSRVLTSRWRHIAHARVEHRDFCCPGDGCTGRLHGLYGRGDIPDKGASRVPAQRVCSRGVTRPT